MVLSLDELARLPQTELVTDIHCVTRWSKKDAHFRGVALQTLLDLVQPSDAAEFVSFVARSTRNHSSSLPLTTALSLQTLLATHFEGQTLAEDHGGPLRCVVPRRYFYKSVKWVEKIELLSQDQPGFWEAESGYHNQADPWQEQRYIASSLSKRDAEQLVEQRDFSGQNLLSIDVSARNLTGLKANQATLRNANFSGCILRQASFQEANLTNANFRKAVLQDANLRGADLEGADFAGADLRGADLTGCSLFGTTFCDADENAMDQAARLDAGTIIDREAMQRLSDLQLQFVQRCLAEGT